MHTVKVIDFSDTTVEQRPFPHFCSKKVFSPALEKDLYNWLSSTTIWELTRTEFYEQYEFSLLHVTLPSSLRCLIEDGLVEAVKKQIEATFEASGLSCRH